MATYGYRCPTDGPFDVVRPIGTAPRSTGCPTCGADSGRRWTAPLLSAADPRRMAAIDATKATADRPAVVDAVPPRPASGRRTVARQQDPRLSRLPRP